MNGRASNLSATARRAILLATADAHDGTPVLPGITSSLRPFVANHRADSPDLLDRFTALCVARSLRNDPSPEARILAADEVEWLCDWLLGEDAETAGAA